MTLDRFQSATSSPKALGAMVRQARREAGLRQEDLALLANVGRRFVVDLEAGKPTCELGLALSVLKVLAIGFGPAGSHKTTPGGKTEGSL